MATAFIQSLANVRTIPFTAGDLVEGLGFLEPVARRAVLFGLEQGLSVDEVIELTHARASSMHLTPLAFAALEHCPRHIRLHYVFWATLQDGMITPLLGLERQVEAAFGGMSWSDLTAAYATMIWVDHECDAENFLMHARQQGIL